MELSIRILIPRVVLLLICFTALYNTCVLFLQMEACLKPVKGAVILTYGAGNGPDKNEDLMKVFDEASKRGVLMLNITQCLKGQVAAEYATGTVRQIS